jgi:hypothetical protein
MSVEEDPIGWRLEGAAWTVLLAAVATRLREARES